MPSWRFFDSFDRVPLLQFRVKEGGDEGDWQEALPPIHNSVFSILLSPKSNLRFRYNSTLEHLLRDLEEEVPAQDLSSYQIIKALVLQRAEALDRDYGEVQFRVFLEDASRDQQLVVQSPWYQKAER